jgi:hypothetical protein
MSLPLVQAAAQVSVILIGCRFWRRYPLFFLSLVVWLPTLLISMPTHSAWEHCVRLPCMLVLIPLQGCSALEVFFALGWKWQLTPKLSLALTGVSASVTLAFWVWPTGTVLQQILRVSLYQRVGTLTFAVLAAAFFIVLEPREIFGRVDGAHLLLFTAWMVTWVGASLVGPAATWTEQTAITWPFIARTALLLAWFMLFRPSASQVNQCVNPMRAKASPGGQASQESGCSSLPVSGIPRF